MPAVQLPAVLMLALLLPRFAGRMEVAPKRAPGADVAHIIQGVLAGIGLIVAAVLISALALGGIGWSLFVATPLLVGVTTGHLAARRLLLTGRSTTRLVLTAATLGTISLVALALEGLVCILLAAARERGPAARAVHAQGRDAP